MNKSRRATKAMHAERTAKAAATQRMRKAERQFKQAELNPHPYANAPDVAEYKSPLACDEPATEPQLWLPQESSMTERVKWMGETIEYLWKALGENSQSTHADIQRAREALEKDIQNHERRMRRLESKIG